jgi:glycosyltransferase involved in cell wall biosynthesis
MDAKMDRVEPSSAYARSGHVADDERGRKARSAIPADLTISAVVPLYNGARFIEQSIASILAQTLPPQEIVVVDDGSTDDGPAIVQRMAAEHPIVLLSKPNGGQASARNLAIAHSTGKLIALLDQDDMWYPHHLERLVEPFCEPRNRPLGWVYSNLDEVDIDGKMVVRECLTAAGDVQHPKRDLVGCLRTDMFVLPSASLLSREAFEAVGGFDERLSGFEDDDLFLRIFRACYDNVFLDEALTKWRIFSGSSSFSLRMGRSRMIYVRKLLEEFPDEPQRGRHFTRNVLVPRFFPWLVREYTLALRSGSEERIRTTLEDLQFLARHRAWVGLVMGMLAPVLHRPKVAGLMLPLGSSLRPLLRRLLR